MRRMKRIISMLCVAVMLVGSMCMETFAEETDSGNVMKLDAVVSGYDAISEGIMPYSTTFTDSSVEAYFDTSGMHITIITSVNDTASVIGVKDIKVQVKSGNNWVTVATSTGGETGNISGCAVSITYPYSVKGNTYRVCCTHYANVDEYRELYHETIGMYCNVTSTAP